MIASADIFGYLLGQNPAYSSSRVNGLILRKGDQPYLFVGGLGLVRGTVWFPVLPSDVSPVLPRRRMSPTISQG